MSETKYPPGIKGDPSGHGGTLPPIDPTSARKLVRADRGGTADHEMPAAERLQRGVMIQRQPDSIWQPEGGIPIRLSMQLRDCDLPITLFVATTNWVTILEYSVGIGRKLVVLDAWLAWSNPYVSLITNTRLTRNDSEIAMKPRRQRPCGCPHQLRAFIHGPATLNFQIARLPNSSGWNYGSIEAELIGWDVDDQFPADMRIFK